MFELYVSSKKEHIKDGRLWRVVAPNGAVSYLCGTMHVSDPEIVQGTPELNFVFGSATKFFFEAPDYRNNDFTDLYKVVEATIKDSLQNISIEKAPWQRGRLLNEQQELFNSSYTYAYNFIEKINAAHNQVPLMSEEQFRLLDPSIISVLLKFNAIKGSLETPFTAQYLANPVFDHVLMSDAIKLKNNKRSNAIILPIEHYSDLVAAELDIANELSADDLLNYYLEHFKKYGEHFNFHYPEHRPPNNAQYQHSSTFKNYALTSCKIFQTTMNALDIWCKYRNIPMMSKVLPHFNEGGCFFATGLKHCIIDGGFIDELTSKNFKIYRVFETPNPNFSFKPSRKKAALHVFS